MKLRATTSTFRLVAPLIVAAVFLLCPNVQAQTIIEPGPPGTINDAILGDTTATGERNSCHYVLRRDEVYIYNQRMSMTADCEWIIEAEEGSGARPVIRAAALPGGEEAPRPFHLFANTTLRLTSLYLDSYDTSLPDPGIPTDNATVRVGADSATIYIDDVRFDRNRQSTIRTDNSQVSVFVTNSEFSNIHNVNRPDQSYIFDTRGNDVDSLVFINNTIWNHPGVVVNNAQKFNYMKWDHNTFVNIGGVPNGSIRLDTLRIEEPGEEDFGVISLGQSDYAVFRNNLLVNPGVAGTETNDVFVPRNLVDIDSSLIEIDSVTFDMVPPSGVDIRNNVISWDDNIATGYPDTIRAYTQDEYYDPTLELFIEEQGSSSSLLAAEVNLEDGPDDVPPSFVTDLYLFASGQQERQPLMFPRDTRLPSGEGDLDFSYPTSSVAFTAAEGGQPVGDLNWFGMAEGYTSGPDNFVSITSSEDDGQLPSAFRLHGNYPNPFNPSTTIRFDLAVPAEVSVEIVDLLGRRVMALPARQLRAGTHHTINVDASGLASGVYLYRVTARTHASSILETGKMILMK